MMKTLFSLLLSAVLVAPAAAQVNISPEVQRLRDAAGSAVDNSQLIKEKEELRKELLEKNEEFRKETIEREGEFREEIRERVREFNDGEGVEIRNEIKTEVRDGGLVAPLGTEMRTQIKILQGEDKERFELKREELKKEFENRAEELRTNVEQRREEAKTRLEEKREEIKNRLEEIKDKQKKEITEKVFERMNELNKNLTERFMEILEKMEEVLVRISSRAGKAEAHGVNVSEVRTVIDNAYEAIASARTAVAAQAGKVYSFDVTTEETLKFDVGEARQSLHNDLKALKETIRLAHDAIRNAAVILAQIPQVDEFEVETHASSTESEDAENEDSETAEQNQ